MGFFREPLTLNESLRAELGGTYATLSNGVTHYELSGPEDGPVLVLVHGFSTPSFIWDTVYPGLAEAGFRVLRYDLFGRGFSDRLNVPYNADLFDRQLLELLDELGFAQPVHLMGLSMGGAIAINFTARHPERVAKLGLVDPAGYAIKASAAAMMLYTPGLGELIMGTIGNSVILAGLAADFHNHDRLPEYTAKYKAQLPYKGFKRAILSTMRNMSMTNMDAVYRQVGAQEGREVMLIWGREDTVVPYETTEKIKVDIPQVVLHTIEGVGHLPHYEKPEVVLPLMVDFFK